MNTVTETCRDCDGHGEFPVINRDGEPDDVTPCGACDGHGIRDVVTGPVTGPCCDCDGTGDMYDGDPCWVCDGRGAVTS